MDHLWSPWRYQYVSNADAAGKCIFCVKASETDDRANYILHRARHNFVILNLYPYTCGHLMVVPYAHIATLEDLPEEALLEMTRLMRDSVKHLRSIYHPSGLNVGMNIGRSAGAGVADHVHMHVLPRWDADANFMTTVGETRVLPEDMATTYAKLSRAFSG
ncbi:MAG TPA: HIT domain-containing protein [Bryobacteraceae bacterium]|jgi:ATP adenylyltransferase|nr:HIT domain-containing protein [Bryobacteraceae bacterium]